MNLEEFKKKNEPIAFWEYIHQNQPGFYVFQLFFYKEYPFVKANSNDMAVCGEPSQHLIT